MSAARPSAGLRPFHFDGTHGRLLCLLHERAAAVEARSPVLFLPPFAEELNKSRRMIALQARSLTTLGHSVLVPDLYGTADSEGDFADARWEIWIEDLVLLRRWLAKREGPNLSLWSLRTGALLGTDLITKDELEPECWMAWQPTVSGQTFLTQFLRLKVAAELTRQGLGVDSRALRAELSSGSCIEVAGYELAGALARSLDAKTLSAALLSRASRVGLFELTITSAPALSALTQRLVAECRRHGATIHAQAIHGQHFWSTPETTVVPELLEASTRFMAERELAP
jgi:exosortase A-associated hydrolase 2